MFSGLRRKVESHPFADQNGRDYGADRLKSQVIETPGISQNVQLPDGSYRRPRPD